MDAYLSDLRDEKKAGEKGSQRVERTAHSKAILMVD